jgi:signal transduction histidine kinase
MSVHWTTPVPSKREFGLGYLAAVALVTFVGLVGLAGTQRHSVVLASVAVFLAVALVGTAGYVLYAFRRVDVGEDVIWRVSRWTALGLAVATLFSFLFGFGVVTAPRSTLVSSMLLVLVTTGGLLGTLLGVVSSFRAHYAEIDRLAGRNTVLNRVLRHNIKNDMNVIMGHTELLAEAVPPSATDHVDAIERAAEEVTRLSRTARHVDRLRADADSTQPIDVTAAVEECVAAASRMYPDADVTADLPDDAWIEANPIVGPVIRNLLENAIEHHDGDPTVRVTVRRDVGHDDRIAICVADDGPGIDEHERTVLAVASEEPTRHGSGLGLWLVKWFADQYDGTLAFEDNDPRGTIVRVTLPSAEPRFPAR